MTLAEALGLGAFDLPEQEEARRIRPYPRGENDYWSAKGDSISAVK